MQPNETGKKRNWFRILIALICIGSGGWLLTNWIGKQIKPIVIAALSNQLSVPVTIKEAHFSLITNFPYASVTLTDVVALPVFTEKFDTLLNVRKCSVLVRWDHLFAKEMVIRRIIIADGLLNLHIDSSGNENYLIWKSDSVKSGQLDINLIELEQVMLKYQNDQASQQLNCLIDQGKVSAVIGEQLKIGAECSLAQPELIIDQITYLRGQPVRLMLAMDYNKTTGEYLFEKSSLEIADLSFALNGKLTDKDEYSDYALSISAEHAKLGSVLSVIPEKYSAKWRKFKTNGFASLKISVKGRQDNKQKPVYQISFKAEDCKLTASQPKITLENINLTGEFISMTNKKTEHIEIRHFDALLNNKKINGSLIIDNLKDPWVKARFNSEASLEDLSRFYIPSYLKGISGDLIIRNGEFAGRLNDPLTHISSGSISIRDAAITFRDRPVSISNIEASLKLDKNYLVVQNFSGNTLLSDFAFAGSFINLWSYLFSTATLELNGTLQSSLLDFNEILRKEQSPSNVTVYRIHFADDFSFQLKMQIQQIKFNQFLASDVTGSVSLQDRSFRARDVSFHAMDGSATISGSISSMSNDSLNIRTDAILHQININKMFQQLGNFNQDVITDRNLKGQITARLKMTSDWTDRLDCNTQTIVAESEITIENGELNDFAPMLALSKFLKGSDLNHIRFSTLKNQIEIKSRQIIIPQMEIKSSAADVSISGTHSFDNMIEYRVQLLLSQLTGRKVKSLHTEFGQIEEDNLGRTRLLLKLSGPATQPRITYDTKALKEKIATEFKKEKQIIKELLKDEFGKNKTDEKVQKENSKQKELEIEEED